MTKSQYNRKIPKLYSPTQIIFWSLRMKVASNGGVIPDCDVEVERTVVRVIAKNGGWKFQIKDYLKIFEWDHLVEVDQICLDEIGNGTEFWERVSND